MLDLSFGLPIVIRDAALKMVAPGPESTINREYYAQENEKEIEEGRGGVEAYEKTDEKARDFLRRLANSEPYHKRQRRIAAEETEGGAEESQQKLITGGTGPIRTHDSRSLHSRGGPLRGRGGARGGRSLAAQAPGPQDILPPRDPNITSLFVTGVEDDLPEHAIRTFFTPFGTIRSLICSHRAHCAFINYATREGAEKAAEACQGRAVIAGCPLRVQWGKPKPLDNLEQGERMAHARSGRDTAAAVTASSGASSSRGITQSEQAKLEASESMAAVAPPPGQDDVHYASLAGD